MKIINTDDIYPVTIKYSGDSSITFTGDNNLVKANDGHPFYINDTLNNLKDITTNKHTFMGLLEANSSSNTLQDSGFDIDTKGPLIMCGGNSLENVFGFDNEYDFIGVDWQDKLAVLFVFDHILNDNDFKYYKIRYRDKVLDSEIITTNTGELRHHMVMDSESDSNTQKFRIVQHGRVAFYLIDLDGNICREPLPNPQGFYSIHFFTSSGEQITSTDFETPIDGYVTDSNWLRYGDIYSPNYSDSESILNIDVPKSIYGVSTSYLLNASFEDINISTNSAIMELDIIPTKDFKTIASELTLIPNNSITDPDAVKFRDYHRIYTGGNQAEGYSNINLGYSSDYSIIIPLKSDRYTYFHIPRTTNETTIQDSGLDLAGAYGGLVPADSDRMYKKLSNYEDMTWWGGGSHNDSQDGTWLCTWLSAGETSNVWMERYYNPGYIDPQTAILLHTDTTNGIQYARAGYKYHQNVVTDVVSTMTIEPGAYYKYYHIGSAGFAEMNSAYRGVSDIDTVVRLQEFNNNEIINDSSSNSNDAYVYNPDSIDLVDMDFTFGVSDESAILLNGNGELRVTASPTLDITDIKSINLWTYNKNFNSNTSTTIFSHYLRGGDKLEYINHGLYYSYLLPSTNGTVTVVRIAPSNITNSADIIGIEDIDGVVTTASVDMDGYQWLGVYDAPSGGEGTPSSKLFKLTQSGVVLESINLDNVNILQVLIVDDTKGLMIYNEETNKYGVEFSLVTAQFGTSFRIGPSDSYQVAFNSIISGKLGYFLSYQSKDVAVINSGGDQFANISVTGYSVYINGNYITLGTSESYNNIVSDGTYVYVTVEGTSSSNNDIVKLYKISIDDYSDIQTITMQLDDSGLNPLNNVFIVREMVDGVSADVIYWVTYDIIRSYILTNRNELELRDTIHVEVPFTGDIRGDFSGYSVNKLTHYINNKTPYLKYTTTVTTSGPDPVEEKKVLTVKPDDFSNNWNMVTIIVNHEIGTDNNITMYINGVALVSLAYPSGGLISNSNGSMLNIGSASEGPLSVSETLSLSGRNLDGGIAEFSIFNKELTSEDIVNTYRSKFTGSSDIAWAIDNNEKYFIEEIQNVFKFKKPGFKSQFFNIFIKNFDILESDRVIYENIIRAEVERSTPVNMKLVDIIWR